MSHPESSEAPTAAGKPPPPTPQQQLGKPHPLGKPKMAQDLPKLPWMKEPPAKMWAAINVASKRLEGNEAMAQFSQQSFVEFVFKSNELEGTLSAEYKDSAAHKGLLTGQLNNIQNFAVPEGTPTVYWPAEGGGSERQTWQQLSQSLKAAKYLCSPLNTPLSVERICLAHKIMMWGALNDDGELLAAGQLRTTSSYSAGTMHAYPPANTIPGRLQEIVDDYNAAVNSADSVPSYQLAAELMYRFVALHPFQDGNGRMSSVLAAYAARAGGVPFMLHLHNGHSKFRQHYMQLLLHADKPGQDNSRLQSFILDCMHTQWQEALAYARLPEE